jgi:transglutaminase-like putative cysteine protease
MYLKTSLLAPIVFAVFLCSFAMADIPNHINKESTADWITIQTVSRPKVIPLGSIQGGRYYLLTDTQIKVPKTESPIYYWRYADMIVNQEGLEKSSQINIKFDPEYETLTLNTLDIIRDGKRINKLDEANISLLQRETELENLIYNGRLTANIILADVRVGDIIDYSYTIVGTNPVYNNIFAFSRYLQWSVPVHKLSIRILWGKQTPLYTTTLNSDTKVQESQQGTFREYSVEQNNLSPVNTNSEAPEWYDPYGAVYFSELQKWKDVVAWALPLYDDAIEVSPELKQVADAIKSDYPNPAQQIVQALKFLQKEIRYLGIEIGSNSHNPSPATHTLQRRYGDCKDKSVLFISLMKLLGIEAYPALVNSSSTRQIGNRPPTVNAFDHVLVKIIYENKIYWLDPTRQYQEGNLSSIYQPDYYYTLVLSKASEELERMANGSGNNHIRVKEHFDLSQGSGKDVILKISSEYNGYAAERQRYQLADEGFTNIQNKYLDFYRDYYTAAELIEKLNISEDDKTGAVFQKEKYLLKKFWTTIADQKKYTASFYANSISGDLTKPKELKRNSPYRINFPSTISHTIEILFSHDNWSFVNSEIVEDNPYFAFKYSAMFNKQSKTLSLNYEYKSLVDFVSAEQFDEYMEARKRANDLTEYTIVDYFESNVGSKNDELDMNEVILFAVLIIYFVAFLFVIIDWRRDVKRQPDFANTPFYPVSITKLVILSFVTFGIYSVYWFYRNWLYSKKNNNSSIRPLVRGIFNQIWYYPLYNRLLIDSRSRYQENRVFAQPLAIVFALIYIVGSLLENVDSFWFFAIAVQPFLLIPLAKYINQIESSGSIAYQYNSRWLWRHTILVLTLFPLIAIGFSSDLNIIANDKVIVGSKIPKREVKYMQRKGVFPNNEKVLYFYSAAFLNIRNDGNGFTDTHVFSYWKDEIEGFKIENVAFSKIRDIDIVYSKTTLEDTIITITRDDNTHFVLYISREKGLDKEFARELKTKWQEHRQPI